MTEAFWGNHKDVHFIYSLIDPKTNEVFYVGQAEDPYARYVQHIRLEGKNREKNDRIKAMQVVGILPIMRREWVAYGQKEADFRESYFIEYYRAAGQPLANRTLSLGNNGHYGRSAYQLEQAERVVMKYPFRWLRRFFLNRRLETLLQEVNA